MFQKKDYFNQFVDELKFMKNIILNKYDSVSQLKNPFINNF